MQQLKIPRMNKWGKMMSKAGSERSKSVTSESEAGTPSPSPSPTRRAAPTFLQQEKATRLPPITETIKQPSSKAHISSAHSLPKIGNVKPEKDDTVTLASGKFNGTTPTLPRPGSRSAFIQTPSQIDVRSHKSPDENSQTEHGSIRSIPVPRKAVSFGHKSRADMSDASAMSKPRQTSKSQVAKNKKCHRKKKFSQTDTAALLIAKAKSEETGIPLPVHSFEERKPFNLVGLPQETIEEYEKHRGLRSRDYAIKCLSVASRFKQKAWLQQVRHAMLIASRGVKRTVNGQPHIFQSQKQPSENEITQCEILENLNKNMVAV